MPATATNLRPATDRQQNFIRTLVRERTSEALSPLMSEIGDALTGQPVRRDLIDRLLLIPALRAGTLPVRSASVTQAIEQPSSGTRAGRMLLAGGIEATVTLANGEHVTVKVRTRKRSGRGWANGAPGEEGARTTIKVLDQRVGWVNLDGGTWTLTLRTRSAEYRQAILAVFEYAATGKTAGHERVQEATRCGRCFQQLTDPVSIDRGIGPECFGRDTGSQHVARERAEAGEAVTVRMSVRDEFSPVMTRVQEDLETLADAMTTPVTDEQAEAAWAAHDVAFAALEQEQERAAFESDPDYQRHQRRQADSLTAMASSINRRQATNLDRARGIIFEALDAYCDGSADQAFALRVLDGLIEGAR